MFKIVVKNEKGEVVGVPEKFATEKEAIDRVNYQNSILSHGWEKLLKLTYEIVEADKLTKQEKLDIINGAIKQKEEQIASRESMITNFQDNLIKLEDDLVNLEKDKSDIEKE